MADTMIKAQERMFSRMTSHGRILD